MTEQLLTFPADQFPDALRWQAVSFIRTEWSQLDGGRLCDTYPAQRRPCHVALVEQELLLSYAAFFRLDVDHAGQRWRLDCLGNVFTFPGARGSGRGRQVVEVATTRIRTGDADVAALLCEPRLLPFYARSGWSEVAAGVTIVGEDAAPFPIDGPTMMLFVSPAGRAARDLFEHEPLAVPFSW